MSSCNKVNFNSALQIVQFNSQRLNTTAQELKNKYGEPSYFYDGSSFDVYEYSQESKQYYNDREYHFEFEDEGLTNIELDYIP